MTRIRGQGGFSLIAAIFLLTAVAVLVVYISNIRVVQQTTALYGVQGARAMQAARAGIEWGTYESLSAGGCLAPATFVIADPALAAFSVNVTCTATTHTEGAAPPVTTYQLTSTASSGTFGSLDFVQRLVRATVSVAPP